MEHELPGVLDGVDEPVSVEELEEVVRRAGQRRRASLIAGAAGLLLCGAVGGALARGPVNDRSTGFAAARQEAQAPKPPMAGMAMAVDGKVGVPLTPVFRREANGIVIRAFRPAWPKTGDPGPLVEAKCVPPVAIHGELSNDGAIAFAFAPEPAGDAFALLGAGKFGQAEGNAATWAVVRPAAGVATVRLRLGEATDAMTPQDGIAFLAVAGDGGDGVVEGLDQAGQVVATQKLSDLDHPAPDPACATAACEEVITGSAVPPGMPSEPPAKPGLAGPPPTTPEDPVATAKAEQAQKSAIIAARGLGKVDTGGGGGPDGGPDAGFAVCGHVPGGPIGPPPTVAPGETPTVSAPAGPATPATTPAPPVTGHPAPTTPPPATAAAPAPTSTTAASPASMTTPTRAP